MRAIGQSPFAGKERPDIPDKWRLAGAPRIAYGWQKSTSAERLAGRKRTTSLYRNRYLLHAIFFFMLALCALPDTLHAKAATQQVQMSAPTTATAKACW